MTSIVRASSKDSQILSEIATVSFIVSHGNSANPGDIKTYVTEKYSSNVIKEELSDTKNIYHIIYYDDRPAGYSKIVFDAPYVNSQLKNIAKLERLYLLKEFYDFKLGLALFQFNVDLSKRNNQAGI